MAGNAEKRPNPEALLKELNIEEKQKNKGKLKIFFGYAAGVGKTYTMLEEAHNLIESGIDAVIGYVEPHQRPETASLIEGLPQIPPIPIAYKSAMLYEFDIDSALKRKPAVILVDELAHTNAKGCRNVKRYQDIEELLRMGIDVYTTVNVQHIEGLHDVVESITGIAVRERVPDSIFDSADKVELVDIEPEDLIARLSEGKIYRDVQAKRALENFFTKENLIALREIALRRTADRVSIAVERNKSAAQNTDYHTGEHIMMCLSSSPSNAKVIRMAAKLAEAFHGIFTALFVETSDFAEMSAENKSRLRENLRLAEQLGAKIATVYGDDVPYQAAEFAKASGVSKIVLGRSVRRITLGFNIPTYVDKLTAYAPNLEVYVIPNKLTKTFTASQKQKFRTQFPEFTWLDTLYLILCLTVATLIGFAFYHIGFAEVNIITVYILASIFTAMIAHGRVYGVIASLCSVLMFNYFFTEPRYTFDAYDKGYPVIFIVMFTTALIISTLIKRIKEQARQSSRRAYRTEVLLETSQKLQQAKSTDGILSETINQIKKLMDREVFLYPVTGNTLGNVLINPSNADQNVHDGKNYGMMENINQYMTADEYAVAQWVFVNNKHAGATTDTLSGAKCLYMSIRSGDSVFAVVGIAMNGEKKLDSFEKSLLIAILAESALALEKENVLVIKNEMTLRANTEQLRSNLLRAISHDLRTPLTSIAGGSSFLLEMLDKADNSDNTGSLDKLDKDTLRSMLSDISNDAQWLSSLVENLLNITRIEDGRLNVNKKPELADEVISAAVSKVIKRSGSRKIDAKKSDDMIFVPMDAQLMIQVIVNLLDNAFRHTKENSDIEINYYTENNKFYLLVSDNGGGLPAEIIDKIFDLFFTAASQNGSDKQRGMGLGLNICKSIVEAHGGTIKAENNQKGGATFKITLPMDA